MYSSSRSLVKDGIDLASSKNIPPGPREPIWTFLSSHAHVLLCLARDPDVRLRDVAELVALTERGVYRIITELEAAGVIERVREGRRNHYEVHPSVALRHPAENDLTVGTLLEPLLSPEEASRLGLATRAWQKEVSR